MLGYPLCKLLFKDSDLNRPLIGDVLLRTDRGVVNCRYQTSENNYLYEFTLTFNPGNSGGPIFDARTGRLISIVKGFKAMPINTNEIVLSEEKAKEFKVYKERAFIQMAQATYSFGFGTPSFVEIFKEHKITN